MCDAQCWKDKDGSLYTVSYPFFRTREGMLMFRIDDVDDCWAHGLDLDMVPVIGSDLGY